jgi:transposase-like protein
MSNGISAALPLVENRETEVLAKAKRRTFTAEYKRQILKKAAACKKPGEIGALLRREGLYSSHLVVWRRARDRGELAGLAAKKRGPPPHQRDDRDRKIVELERALKRSEARAERAETLVDLQKKLATVLGLSVVESDEKSK